MLMNIAHTAASFADLDDCRKANTPKAMDITEQLAGIKSPKIETNGPPGFPLTTGRQQRIATSAKLILASNGERALFLSIVHIRSDLGGFAIPTPSLW
jgi:hypothetical protein